jgi:hypothetical protein
LKIGVIVRVLAVFFLVFGIFTFASESAGGMMSLPSRALAAALVTGLAVLCLWLKWRRLRARKSR